MFIVCAGMKRSGSTLQYNLVRLLVEEAGVGRGEGFFETPESPEHQETFNGWIDDDQLHVIKSHKIPPDAAELIEAGRIRICYIYRDIRDVAVSMKLKSGKPVTEIRDSLSAALNTYHKIKNMQQVLWQKYEDLMVDPQQAVLELAEFLDVETDRGTAGKIADACSMQRAEKISKSVWLKIRSKVASGLTRIGVSNSLAERLLCLKRYDKKTLLNPNHVSKNKGGVGVWRDDLTAEELALVMEDHSDWLKEMGYVAEGEVTVAQSAGASAER